MWPPARTAVRSRPRRGLPPRLRRRRRRGRARARARATRPRTSRRRSSCPSGAPRSRPGEARGWLCVAAAHTALNWLRSGRRRAAREGAAAAAGEAVVSDVAEVVVASEERGRVRAALAQLPRKQAVALVLRHSGLSYAEVAAALDLSPGSVGTTVRRAESALREELSVMRHPAEGVLRRLLDEPAGVATADRLHVAGARSASTALAVARRGRRPGRGSARDRPRRRRPGRRVAAAGAAARAAGPRPHGAATCRPAHRAARCAGPRSRRSRSPSC